jgi:hypothetical protein
MASSDPKRPGQFEELDEETKAILTERLRTADEDAKTARDARVVIAELRNKLTHKHSTPQ